MAKRRPNKRHALRQTSPTDKEKNSTGADAKATNEALTNSSCSFSSDAFFLEWPRRQRLVAPRPLVYKRGDFSGTNWPLREGSRIGRSPGLLQDVLYMQGAGQLRGKRNEQMPSRKRKLQNDSFAMEVPRTQRGEEKVLRRLSKDSL